MPFQVQELLEAGACPNVEDAAGWRPLHEAACSNSDHASKVPWIKFCLCWLLVKHFAIICVPITQVVQLLVEHGAEVDVCDQRGGITPLHDAVSFGSKEVVEALLEAGARAGRRMYVD